MKQESFAAFGFGALLGFLVGKGQPGGGLRPAKGIKTREIRLDRDGKLKGEPPAAVPLGIEERVRWHVSLDPADQQEFRQITIEIRSRDVEQAAENPFGANPRKRVPKRGKARERRLTGMVTTNVFDGVGPDIRKVTYEYAILVDGRCVTDPQLVIHR